jgi:hypothetical protein
MAVHNDSSSQNSIKGINGSPQSERMTNTASIPFSGPPYAMLFDNHFHLTT